MDIVIAATALAVSAVFFVLAAGFPQLAADPGGLALFPRIAALVTGGASAAFLIYALLGRTSPSLWPRLFTFSTVLRTRRSELSTFALVGLLPFGIQALGFVAATFAFTALVLIISGVRLHYAALVTVLTTMGTYVAFALILGAILPTGYLFDWE